MRVWCGQSRALSFYVKRESVLHGAVNTTLASTVKLSNAISIWMGGHIRWRLGHLGRLRPPSVRGRCMSGVRFTSYAAVSPERGNPINYLPMREERNGRRGSRRV